ncbi:MAG: ThiF family adenylyltransferase [Planctomycetota bacterium]
MTDKLARYIRQMVFSPIGEKGQKKISKSSAAVVGCGALGGVSANLLARAGVGSLTIIDRDFVEFDNLQRQMLFTEKDAEQHLPKALVVAERLKESNSEIKIGYHIIDLNQRNVEKLLRNHSVIVDATDNLDTRFLINDFCVKNKVPWIYGAALGSTGMVKTILPGKTACLRCFLPSPPPPGSIPTCETGGILNSTTGIVGSLEVSETLKIIVGGTENAGSLIYIDVWSNRFDVVEVNRRENCPACADGNFEFLNAKQSYSPSRLCGHNAVEIIPEKPTQLDLEKLNKKLSKIGDSQFNGCMVIFKTGKYQIFIFPDARAIIKGTYDFPTAKTLYSKFIGI